MKKSIILTALVLFYMMTSDIINSQSFSYRFSFMEEATKNCINNSTPLNRDNNLVIQNSEQHISSANLYCVYDFLSGSFGFLTKTGNVNNPEYDFAIRELTADLNLTDKISFEVGRKILKWGTGYAFNPTGVVEPERLSSDPSDRLKTNDGRNMASLNAYYGESSLTLVFLNDCEYKNSSWEWGKNEIAFRGYTFLSGLDLSLIGYYKTGDRFEAGTNFSYVFGENLEIHGEALGKQGSSQMYHDVVINDAGNNFYTDSPYSSFYDHSDRIFWKFLVGGQFTFDNGLNIVFEYYHNDEGLTKNQWNRWLNFVKFHDNIQNGNSAVQGNMLMLSKNNLLWALKTLSQNGTMQDYFFNRIYYPETNWNCELLTIMNAADGSAVIIPTFTYKYSENITAYTRFSIFVGSVDSEYENLFMKGILTIGLGVNF